MVQLSLVKPYHVATYILTNHNYGFFPICTSYVAFLCNFMCPFLGMHLHVLKIILPCKLNDRRRKSAVLCLLKKDFLPPSSNKNIGLSYFHNEVC